MFIRLGSQFFITLGDNLDYLDKEHCVFGEVVEGHDALLNINEAICDENHIPYQDIRYLFKYYLKWFFFGHYLYF